MAVIRFEQVPKSEAPQLFLADCHLDDPPDRIHVDKDNITLTGTLRIMSVRAKTFKWCQYKVGQWDNVLMVWPFTWEPPAANRLGWLPKCEFGHTSPYFTDINPDLVYPIQPFTYIAHNGEEYTPSDEVAGP